MTKKLIAFFLGLNLILIVFLVFVLNATGNVDSINNNVIKKLILRRDDLLVEQSDLNNTFTDINVLIDEKKSHIKSLELDLNLKVVEIETVQKNLELEQQRIDAEFKRLAQLQEQQAIDSSTTTVVSKPAPTRVVTRAS